jgi:hypothetical protein
VFSSSAMRMGVSRMRAGRREYSLIFSSYAVIGDVAKCVRGMAEDLRADGVFSKMKILNCTSEWPNGRRAIIG